MWCFLFLLFFCSITPVLFSLSAAAANRFNYSAIGTDIPHRPIGPYTLESMVFLCKIFYVKKTGLLQTPLGGWKQGFLGKCQFGRNWKNVNTPPMELIEKVPMLSALALSSKRYFFEFQARRGGKQAHYRIHVFFQLNFSTLWLGSKSAIPIQVQNLGLL